MGWRFRSSEVEPVEQAAPRVAPAVLASYFSRLHDKLSTEAGLLDPSWAYGNVRQIDCLAWSSRLRGLAAALPENAFLFSSLPERLVLLTPAELQRLLCASALLSRRESFRHCIDGVKVRTLQRAIGKESMVALLSSQGVHRPPVQACDWRVDALLGEAFGHIDRVYRASHSIVVDALRIGLPRELPIVPSDYQQAELDALLREVHHWYPELTWLFG